MLAIWMSIVPPFFPPEGISDVIVATFSSFNTLKYEFYIYSEYTDLCDDLKSYLDQRGRLRKVEGGKKAERELHRLGRQALGIKSPSSQQIFGGDIRRNGGADRKRPGRTSRGREKRAPRIGSESYWNEITRRE